MVCIGPKCGFEAALQTSTWIWPKARIVSSTKRWMCSFEEIFAAMAMARPSPYLALIAAASTRQGSMLREETTTFAPCSAIRSTIARPMPRDEPVTTATFPLRSNSDTVVPSPDI